MAHIGHKFKEEELINSIVDLDITLNHADCNICMQVYTESCSFPQSILQTSPNGTLNLCNFM